MNVRKTAIAFLCVVYIFLWIGGVVAHTFLGGPPAHVAWTASLFLFVSGAIVLLSAQVNTIWRLVAAGAIGMLAEIIGVHTGVPFGRYEYTPVLYPRILEVPVVMACAWIVLAAYVQQIVAPFKLPRLIAVPVFALALTSIDLVIDPIAAGPLGYWAWKNSGLYYGIPASNFVGWLFVSACVGLVNRTQYEQSPMHWFVGYSITAFFTFLAAVNGMTAATAIGLVLLTIPLLLGRRKTSRNDSERAYSSPRRIHEEDFGR